MKNRKRKRAEANLRRLRKIPGMDSADNAPQSLEESRQDVQPTASPTPEFSAPIIMQRKDLCKALVTIATNAWRAKMKMTEQDGEPKDDVRKYYRHVEAVLDAVADLGIEINDYTGRRYVDGMDVSVVTFETTAGVTEEEVLETLRPEIRWLGQRLQQAEVVVACPGKS